MEGWHDSLEEAAGVSFEEGLLGWGWLHLEVMIYTKRKPDILPLLG